ncbi:MAG: leucyl aminopeptidase [Chloroflexi bacterium]|nr:leucyl aminopeptidase [Chloroflexota bacterium]
MPNITINNLNEINLNKKSDTLVIGYFQDKPTNLTKVNEISSSLINETIKSNDLPKELGEIVVLHTPKKIYKEFNYSKIFVLGLGESKNLDNNSLRRAAGNLGAFFNKSNSQGVNLFLDSFVNNDDNFEDLSKSLIEGFLLGSYTFNNYKSKKNNEKKEITIMVSSDKPRVKIEELIRRAVIIADAEKRARNLVNEPANILSPTKLSDIAMELSGDHLKCNVLSGEECKQLGMNAFIGVSQGSVEEPKLIHLSYKPNSEDSSIWYIGKAITFDSGGLSLKPSGGMVAMKGDMGGAASVISAIYAISKLGLNINIEALCLATENMPSGSAQRPSDVVKAMDGTFIEVENTDAEGRLTLADAITYAKTFNPKYIVDIATLTGAAGIGLGKGNISGFSNNDKLMGYVKDAGLSTGDFVWQLPLDPVSKKQNHSDIADLKNTGGRLAGTITAAHFINHFVKDTPWVHLDIAANMMSSSNDGWYTKGATGIPTRLLIELAYILQN